MLKQGNHIDLEILIDGLPDMSAVKSAKYSLYSLDRKTEVLSKSIGNGITKAAASLSIALTDVDTRLLTGDYYHELNIIDLTDKLLTVMSGNVYFQSTYNNR